MAANISRLGVGFVSAFVSCLRAGAGCGGRLPLRLGTPHTTHARSMGAGREGGRLALAHQLATFLVKHKKRTCFVAIVQVRLIVVVPGIFRILPEPSGCINQLEITGAAALPPRLVCLPRRRPRGPAGVAIGRASLQGFLRATSLRAAGEGPGQH